MYATIYSVFENITTIIIIIVVIMDVDGWDSAIRGVPTQKINNLGNKRDQSGSIFSCIGIRMIPSNYSTNQFGLYILTTIGLTTHN